MTDIGKFLILQLVTEPNKKCRRKYKEGYIDATMRVYNFVKQMEENMNKEMTAVDFIKAKNRLCINNKMCDGCPIYGERRKEYLTCDEFTFRYPEKVVKLVEEWARERPANTKQSEFLKLYPNAAINDGAIKLCPLDLNANFNCRATSERISCNTCRKDYWLQEVEK